MNWRIAGSSSRLHLVGRAADDELALGQKADPVPELVGALHVVGHGEQACSRFPAASSRIRSAIVREVMGSRPAVGSS